MFCLYTLPLARPAQSKIQMLTDICCIVKLIPWNKVNLSHLYKKQTIRNEQTRLVNLVLLKSQQFRFVVWKLVRSSDALEIEKNHNLQKELSLIVPKESTYNFVSRKCKKHGESEIVLVIWIKVSFKLIPRPQLWIGFFSCYFSNCPN